MRLMLVIHLILSVNHLIAQTASYRSYWERLKEHRSFYQKIEDGLDWSNLLIELNQKDSLFFQKKEFLEDIPKSIAFIEKYGNSNQVVDSVLAEFCRWNYYWLPRQIGSGRLDKRLYIDVEKENERIRKSNPNAPPPPPIPPLWLWASADANCNSFELVRQITELPITESLPALLRHLENDAATRLMIFPTEYDEYYQYQKIGNVVLDIIRIVTWCHFSKYTIDPSTGRYIDNRRKVKKQISKWWSATKEMDQLASVQYFLKMDSINFEARIKTYQNLAFHGYDSLATDGILTTFEEEYSDPCQIPWHQLWLVLDQELKDSILCDNCLSFFDSAKCENAHFYTQNRESCFTHLINQPNEKIPYALLASVFESFDEDRKIEKSLWWYVLQHLLYDEPTKTAKPLILSLFNIKIIPTENNFYQCEFCTNFSEQQAMKFRVCDYALWRYHKSIEPLSIDWADEEARDEQLKKILENYNLK